MNRLSFIAVALALLIVVPLHAQTQTIITPTNASQLTELGRASFLLEPAIAPDGLALSPDGEQLALATSNGVYLVSISDFLSTGQHAGPIGRDAHIWQPDLQFQQARFSPTEPVVVALAGQRQPTMLYIWETDTFTPRIGYPRNDGSSYQSLVFRPGTTWLYLSYFQDRLRATDNAPIGGFGLLPTDALRPFELFTKSEPNTRYDLRSFSPDGNRLYYVTENQATNTSETHVLNVETGEAVAPPLMSTTAILSPDWTTAIEIDSSADLAFLLHDLAAGSTIRVTVEANTLSQALSFSPDSQLIVGTTFTGDFVSIRLWDANTGAEVAVIPLGEFDVLDALFSSDMTRLIARIARSMPITPEPEQLVVWSIS